MPKKYEPGDLVRLKSGGPLMVVEVENDDGSVSCIWFSTNEREQWTGPHRDNIRGVLLGSVDPAAAARHISATLPQKRGR